MYSILFSSDNKKDKFHPKSKKEIKYVLMAEIKIKLNYLVNKKTNPNKTVPP